MAEHNHDEEMPARMAAKIPKHDHEHDHVHTSEKKCCFEDLSRHLDLSKCSVLNAADAGALKAVLEGHEGEGEAPILTSDCDEQLLFGIAFNTPVRLQSISFKAPPSGPQTVK